jgi:hypothetical protein
MMGAKEDQSAIEVADNEAWLFKGATSAVRREV